MTMAPLQIGALLLFVIGVLCIVAALLDGAQPVVVRTDLERRIRGRR